MKVAPGPPLYQYAGTFLGVRTSRIIEVRLHLTYVRVGIGNQDYGLGVQRRDGWLTIDTELHLAGLGYQSSDAATEIMGEISKAFPTDQIVVQLERYGNGIVRQVAGRWSGYVWPFGEEIPLNTRLNEMYPDGVRA